ncbi:MAG: hypothetical protein ACRBF0_14570 [Calditrichia bacterium]
MEINNRSSLGYCWWQMAELYEKWKNTGEAQKYAEKALKIFTELKMPRERDAVQELVDGLELSRGS